MPVDVHRSASYRNMIEHLTAPLQAGAVDSPVAVSADGTVSVGRAAREPLLLLAPADDLGAARLVVAAALPGGATAGLRFEPYTERGSFVPLYRPPVSRAGVAEPFSIQLGAAALGGAELLPAELAALLEARLVEGILGRMLYLLGAEKQRLRRLARELAAMRALDEARDDALDRLGAELGVPRFADTLAFRGGEIVTDIRREPDVEYRRRLGVYRPWLLPTRRRILELLNGAGAEAAPNAGPIGELGLAERFSIAEDDNDFAVAIAVVGAEDPDLRAGLLEFVRAVHLILPRDDGASNAVHAARFLPGERQGREQELRDALRRHFSFAAAPDAALAPMLAAALARAGACRRALGVGDKWNVLRTQRADAGSRYELGLGADVEPLAPQQLNRMAQAHATREPHPDPELEGLLASMAPVPARRDPDGRWLLEPCGLKTVHRVDGSTLYLSHLPVFGLTIAGPSELEPTGWTQILAGDFTGSERNDLLFYERATGTAELYRTDGRGGLALLGSDATWRKTWTALVRGNFGPGRFDDLLLYERSSGAAEVRSTDGAGGFAVARPLPDLGRAWSAIVAGRFHHGPFSDLFLYSRSTGTAEIHALGAPAEPTLLKRHTGLPRTWTHVLAGNFLSGPYTDLLCYDRGSGTVEVYATDGRGGLRLVRRAAGWRRGFTHLSPGRFGPSGSTGVLAYDRAAGAVVLHDGDGEGRLVRMRSYSGLRRTWTQVVAATSSERPFSDVLLYERGTGAAELHSTNGRGGMSLVRAYRSFRRSSPQQYEARYHAPGDPGSHVVLVQGLERAAAAWAAPPFAGPAWTVLADADAAARWDAAGPRPAQDPALGVFRAAGLPALVDAAATVRRLREVAPELVETVRLDAGQAAAIVAGSAAAAAQLRDLVGVVRAQGIASALPLVAGQDEVLLVLGATALPEAGINLSDRRSAGFRWYLVPLQGSGGELSAVGARTLFTPADAGVYALVAVGYARGGKTDPYEYRVELPRGARLDPLQYEFLMNVLEHTFPVGVEVNTYAIRHDHVDLDGDGDAEPLRPQASRTYRAFRRRHRGEIAVLLDEG